MASYLLLPIVVIVTVASVWSASSDTVDHAAILRSLDGETLEIGRELYHRACIACHGTTGSASLPSARSFSQDSLQYGNDPYSMWRSVTYGRGQMAAQGWLTPEERYYVVQYIREELIEPHNPSEYFEVTEAWLESLPGPEESEVQDVARAAAEGLQAAGQVWAQRNPGDYGRATYSQIEDRASDALTVVLDHGVYLSYDLLRMNLVAAWQGDLNLRETRFEQYRGEGRPMISGTDLHGLGTWHWGYWGAYEALDQKTSPRTPLPEALLTYRGHYRHADDVILSWSVLGRDVLERPSAEELAGAPLLVHDLHVGPTDTANRLVAGRVEGKVCRAGVYDLDDPGAADAPVQRFAEGRVAVGWLGNRYVAAAVVGDVHGLFWTIDAGGRLVLHVPSSESPRSIRVLRRSGRGLRDLASFASRVARGR